MTANQRRGVRFGKFLQAVGIICFFFPLALVIFVGQRLPDRFPLPLGQVSSVAVDRSGRIYCASEAYCRVQQYTPQGRFIRGWFIPRGELLKVAVDTDGTLQVWSIKSNTHYVFDPNSGKLLSEERFDRPSDEVGAPEPLHWVDERFNDYQVLNPWLYPRILKTTPKGVQHVVVSVPIYLLPLAGSLPPWLIVAAGGLVMWCFSPPRQPARPPDANETPV